MLSPKMVDAINKQINEELASAYLYLGMSQYYQECKLGGFASWLHAQADEELEHAMKFIHYLEEQGAVATLMPIPAPPKKWKSPEAAFEAVLKHEQHITASINKLVDLAISLKDHATHGFLGWYVKEQVEEEGNVTKVLDAMSLVGTTPHALFLVDREMARRAAAK